MKNGFNSIKEFLSPEEWEEIGFPTASFAKQSTGLPVIIWVCEKWISQKFISPIILIARN